MADKATVLTDMGFSPSYLGKPIAYGAVDIFLNGTVTRANSWRDSNKSVLNTNPVILDAEGKANIFLDDEVSYDIILKTKDGFTVDALDGFESNVPLTTVVDLAVVSIGTGYLKITNTSGDDALLEPVNNSTAGLMSVGQLARLNNTKDKAESNKTDITALKNKLTFDNGYTTVAVTHAEYEGSVIRYKKVGIDLYILHAHLIWKNGTTEVIANIPFNLDYRVSFSSHSQFPTAQAEYIGGNGQLTISQAGDISFYRGANNYSQWVHGYFSATPQ